MIIALIFLISLLAASSYANWNLMKKQEYYEDKLREYDEFFANLDQEAQLILTQIKNIDIRGSFEADDEVGMVYAGIKSVVSKLGAFFNR